MPNTVIDEDISEFGMPDGSFHRNIKRTTTTPTQGNESWGQRFKKWRTEMAGKFAWGTPLMVAAAAVGGGILTHYWFTGNKSVTNKMDALTPSVQKVVDAPQPKTAAEIAAAAYKALGPVPKDAAGGKIAAHYMAEAGSDPNKFICPKTGKPAVKVKQAETDGYTHTRWRCERPTD